MNFSEPPSASSRLYTRRRFIIQSGAYLALSQLPWPTKLGGASGTPPFQEFVLIRPEDLQVLRLRVRSGEVSFGYPNPTLAQKGADGVSVTLFFPPQHILEMPYSIPANDRMLPAKPGLPPKFIAAEPTEISVKLRPGFRNAPFSVEEFLRLLTNGKEGNLELASAPHLRLAFPTGMILRPWRNGEAVWVHGAKARGIKAQRAGLACDRYELWLTLMQLGSPTPNRPKGLLSRAHWTRSAADSDPAAIRKGILDGPVDPTVDPTGMMVVESHAGAALDAKMGDRKIGGLTLHDIVKSVKAEIDKANASFRFDHLSLSELGATASFLYRRSLNAPLPSDGKSFLIEWYQRSTLGRDQFVRITTVGYYLPFLHLVANVTIWERRPGVHPDAPDSEGAILLESNFHVVLQPRKVLGTETSGIANSARDAVGRAGGLLEVTLRNGGTPMLRLQPKIEHGWLYPLQGDQNEPLTLDYSGITPGGGTVEGKLYPYYVTSLYPAQDVKQTEVWKRYEESPASMRTWQMVSQGASLVEPSSGALVATEALDVAALSNEASLRLPAALKTELLAPGIPSETDDQKRRRFGATLNRHLEAPEEHFQSAVAAIEEALVHLYKNGSVKAAAAISEFLKACGLFANSTAERRLMFSIARLPSVEPAKDAVDEWLFIRETARKTVEAAIGSLRSAATAGCRWIAIAAQIDSTFPESVRGPAEALLRNDEPNFVTFTKRAEALQMALAEVHLPRAPRVVLFDREDLDLLFNGDTLPLSASAFSGRLSQLTNEYTFFAGASAAWQTGWTTLHSELTNGNVAWPNIRTAVIDCLPADGNAKAILQAKLKQFPDSLARELVLPALAFMHVGGRVQLKRLMLDLSYGGFSSLAPARGSLHRLLDAKVAEIGRIKGNINQAGTATQRLKDDLSEAKASALAELDRLTGELTTSQMAANGKAAVEGSLAILSDVRGELEGDLDAQLDGLKNLYLPPARAVIELTAMEFGLKTAVDQISQDFSQADPRHLVAPAWKSAHAVIPAISAAIPTLGPIPITPVQKYLDGGFEREFKKQLESGETELKARFGSTMESYAQLKGDLQQAGDAIKSGVAAVNLTFAGLSREIGAVSVSSLKEKAADEARRFAEGMVPEGTADILRNVQLFGVIPLNKLIEQGNALRDMPQVISKKLSDGIESKWAISQPLQNKDFGMLAFTPNGQALKITNHSSSRVVDGRPVAHTRTEGTLSETFSVTLFETIIIHFSKLKFVSDSDSGFSLKPEFEAEPVSFAGALQFLTSLEALLKTLFPSADSMPKARLEGEHLVLTKAIPAKDIAFGNVSLSHLAIHAGLGIPLGRKPLKYAFSFCSKTDPCLLSVNGFSGSMHFGVSVDSSGHREIDGSLGFGGALNFSTEIAKGEVAIIGGAAIFSDSASGESRISAFVHAWGRADVLGLITIAIDLYIALSYVDRNEQTELYGSVSVSVRIRVGLYTQSRSFRFERKIHGSKKNQAAPSRATPAISAAQPAGAGPRVHSGAKSAPQLAALQPTVARLPVAQSAVAQPAVPIPSASTSTFSDSSSAEEPAATPASMSPNPSPPLDEEGQYESLADSDALEDYLRAFAF